MRFGPLLTSANAGDIVRALGRLLGELSRDIVRIRLESALALLAPHVAAGGVLAIWLRADRLRGEAMRGPQVFKPGVLRTRLARIALNRLRPR